jgi:hypothetical protein
MISFRTGTELAETLEVKKVQSNFGRGKKEPGLLSVLEKQTLVFKDCMKMDQAMCHP